MSAKHAYRSDVVGSLLRPAYLKDARTRHAAGSMSDAELKRVEDRAVDEAVALQTRTGMSVVTDGEMRRYAYFGHFIDAIEGFDKFGGWAIPFRDEAGNELLFQRAVVVSRLRRRRHLCAEEFTYLRARTDRPVQGHADQRAQHDVVLRSGEVGGGVSHARGVPGRRGRHPQE